MCQFVPPGPVSLRDSSGKQCAHAIAALALALGMLGLFGVPRVARACGGLFCSGGGGSTTTSGGVVNQTAERILFIDNADATITAVIQILYEGPSEKFAWIVPVSGVPDIQVSSGVILDALQRQTNPSYQVSITRNCPVYPSSGGSFGGSCECGQCAASGASPTVGLSGPTLDQRGGQVVTVEAAGSIGPYDYSVISVQPLAFDKAAVALQWLMDNGFDASQQAADALRPYLDDGLNLLAFRLQKHASVGSIRPVMITYAGEAASIPIGPTAVAANEDMGVLLWVAAQARAVPTNYRSVVLDEVRIDWFKPGDNYDAVVSAAADEAGGQAFVTESAGAFTGISSDPTLASAQSDFTAYTQATHGDWLGAVRDAWRWQSWDGFDDALRAAAKLPAGVTFDAFRSCVTSAATAPDAAVASTGLSDCLTQNGASSASTLSFDLSVWQKNLDELVVTPVIATSKKLSAQSYLTRMYTKLSPEEMTVDPVFEQNASAEAVSNMHLAQGSVPCSGTLATIMLPQGTNVGAETNTMTWPVAAQSAPAALQVLQYGKSGPPQVLLDEHAAIASAKFGLAACGPMNPGGTPTGTTPSRGGAAGGSSAGHSPFSPFPTGTDGSTETTGPTTSSHSSSGGCHAASVGSTATVWPWTPLLACIWLVARRRQRSRAASDARDSQR